jgi:hypothetical protein
VLIKHLNLSISTPVGVEVSVVEDEMGIDGWRE